MKNKLSLPILFFVLILLLCHTGCMTTTQKGTAIGAGTGAGIGALIGSIIGNAGIGAAIGAGVGALGGALVADSIDQKREEREKAEIQRRIEQERGGSGKSDYYKGREAQRSEATVYPTVINIDEENEDLFVRNWQDDHWVYTPINNPNETNLFRRMKDENGYWIFIPIDKKEFGENEYQPIPSHSKSGNGPSDKDQVPQKLPLSEKEKARKDLEDELEKIRNGNKQ